MKALKPSAKESKRYLIVEGKNLNKNIPESIYDFLGVLGMSKTALSFIKTSSKNTVISINRTELEKVRASFCVWPEKITVKKVSGTLKGLGLR